MPFAGPFGFAWVDPTETTFDEGTHFRYDEIVLSFTVDHSEGNFAAFTGRIKNPHEGLLAPSRKSYFWISYNTGSEIKPLFFGRLVGIPSNILDETITIIGTAQPDDYPIRKHDLAQTLKVRPYYDAIGLDESKRDDPDAILEGYSARYHIDRVTHEVTISDHLIGEDGTAVFTEGVPYKSLQINIGAPPIPSVTVEGTVTWPNASTGSLHIGNWVFETLTGSSLISDWYKPGASLGGGWSVAAASIHDVYGIDSAPNSTFHWQWKNIEKVHIDGDAISHNVTRSGPIINAPTRVITLTRDGKVAFMDPYNPDFVDQTTSSLSTSSMVIPTWKLEASLDVRYEAGQSRTEKVSFTLNSDFQRLVTAAPPSGGVARSPELIQVDGADVSLPVLQNDFITGLPLVAEAPPIGDPSFTSFMTQERGHQYIEYLIALGRAKILMSADAVEIVFACPFLRAIDLSCRMNAQIVHRRIPGGVASGKIKKYSFGCDGPSGAITGSVSIGCSIGNSGHAATSAGVETYVEAGYVDAGYQYNSGTSVPIGIGDVAYSLPAAATNPDGFIFPLTADQVVLRAEPFGSLADQKAILEAAIPDVLDALSSGNSATGSIDEQQAAAQNFQAQLGTIFEDHGVGLDFQLRSVDSASFNAEYPLTVSPLFAPQTIDLLAPSSA